MDHEERLRLAQHFTELLLEKCPYTLCVGVCGSTAKGEDREHSDLEMVAITRDEPPVPYYYLICKGIVVEIEIRSLRKAEEVASEVTWRWPLAADQWIHVLPTHDPKGTFERLAMMASNPDKGRLKEMMVFALIWAYHDLGKMQNFAKAGEKDLLRHMAPSFADYIAMLLALLNEKYYNGVRNIVSLPNTFKVLPVHFQEDYLPLFSASAPTSSMIDHAERLYSECSDLLRARGLSLPSEADLVAALKSDKTEAQEWLGLP